MNAKGVGSPARGVPFPQVTDVFLTAVATDHVTIQLEVATPLLQDTLVWIFWRGADGVTYHGDSIDYEAGEPGPFNVDQVLPDVPIDGSVEAWMVWRDPVTSELAYESPHFFLTD